MHLFVCNISFIYSFIVIVYLIYYSFIFTIVTIFIIIATLRWHWHSLNWFIHCQNSSTEHTCPSIRPSVKCEVYMWSECICVCVSVKSIWNSKHCGILSLYLHSGHLTWILNGIHSFWFWLWWWSHEHIYLYAHTHTHTINYNGQELIINLN